MLGDLMGNMQGKQDELKKKLDSIDIVEDGNGIKIEASASREIKNISIDPDLLQDKEQLEDLLIVSINKLQEKIAAAEALESQNMLNDLLPPGMAGLFGG